ncbi:hypothetical protein TBLA_0E01980 [Henningerozyma blattae CBS 6284]|uniref:Splicing factor 3A subunit 1 conserved domain-containing protein n=1 Tax=Henningerozyma blattae (strain ATCC 34711 / CBS 6284 / DSM 70876 / NBRC 10599 / NRRL Y-10934 / UCD 77-7) TaxID=1071380 RepID=I2H4E9_HENB6|nr:hypothetical protein TBLA_0E01980 [Tetrapisispora blattae CBS 6284]CCH61251.1 hypothetical protein TBLA_0E01980 [Tetrapisispora blattae CBS 6284]
MQHPVFRYLNLTGVDEQSRNIITSVAAFWALCDFEGNQKKLDELINLAKEEKNKDDSKLKFLEETHPLNNYFIELREQFTAILKDDKHYKKDHANDDTTIGNLEWIHSNNAQVLSDSVEDATWVLNQSLKEKEQNEWLELARLQFAAIQWDTFQTIGSWIYPDNTAKESNYLPALDFSQLALQRVNEDEPSIFQKVQPLKNITKTKEDGAKQSDTNTKPGTTATTKSKRKKIKAAGETRLAQKKQKRSGAVECPITHKLIPEDKFDSHLKSLLADPNYKIERQAYLDKHKLSNLAEDEVFLNLQKLSKR